MTAKRGPMPASGHSRHRALRAGHERAPRRASVIKLSSNETPLGPSPAAVEAFMGRPARSSSIRTVRPSRLREAIAQALWTRCRPHRLRRRLRRTAHLLATAYLGPGDEAIFSEHGFLVYRIAILARGATPVVAPETRPDAPMSMRSSARGHADRRASCSSPIPTIRPAPISPLDEVRRLHAGLPSDVLLVLDAAYAEYVRAQRLRSRHRAGREPRTTSVMTRTFSKIYGLAGSAHRLGLLPGREVADAAQPHPRAVQHLDAPASARRRGAGGSQAIVQRSAVAHNDTWRAWLTESIGGARTGVTPSVAAISCWSTSRRHGRLGARGRRLPALARHHPARRVANYGLPDCLRMTIGLEDDNRAVRRGAARTSWADAMTR